MEVLENAIPAGPLRKLPTHTMLALQLQLLENAKWNF